MIPKAVVFDLGKVLVDFDFQVFARRLAKNADLSSAEIMTQVVESKLLEDYEYGRISSAEFFEQAKRRSGYRGDYESFRLVFGQIFSAIPEMIAGQQRLKAAGVPTFVFSNTSEIAIETIQRQFEFYGGFEGYVLSYEHGFMKPELGLYDVVERVVGLKGGDIAYIDDRNDNVATALGRGWRGIRHVAPETTLQELRENGLSV